MLMTILKIEMDKKKGKNLTEIGRRISGLSRLLKVSILVCLKIEKMGRFEEKRNIFSSAERTGTPKEKQIAILKKKTKA